MPAPTIADTLKFANLQMATEALYRFNATPPGTILTPGDKFVGDIPTTILTAGIQRGQRLRFPHKKPL